MTRTNKKYTRFYMDGYDLSGDVSEIGPLSVDFDTEEVAGMNWEIKGSLLGQATVSIGDLNGIFNGDTAGLHEFASANSERDCIIPIGSEAVPAAGDPVFCGKFHQKNYMAVPGNVMVTATASFGPQSPGALEYDKAWGVLLKAAGNVTAENTASGIDNAAETTAGGYMAYQLFSKTGALGTITISVEDSDDDGDTDAYAELATSGAIAVGSVPTSGIVQLATTATVKRYLRWQVAFSTATGANFALAFVRG